MNYLPFHEALEDCSRLAGKVPQASCLHEGNIPVIGQGKQAVEGFTNDPDLVFRGDLPVILFGDHTAAFKFINRPFARGADGTKLYRPRTEHLDAKFAWHFLQTVQLPQSGYDRKTKYLENVVIPLPPLEEQRRIAAILDKAAQLTEACASLQAAHRRMGESLFIQAFGEPRTNPLDLPSARLGAIADCQLGKMLDKKRQSGCSKRPYLRNANVRWFEIDTSDVLFMDIGDHEIDRFGVSQEDLLVCEGGEPGRSAIWKGGNGVIGFQKALHRVRADRHKVLPEYLNWALWMFAQRGLLSDHITSATIAHLTREKLVNINILIPPIPVQERFARQLEALNALSQSAKSRNQILRSLNSSTFSTLLGWCAGK
jgi:type I restriction enzyme S subunit